MSGMTRHHTEWLNLVEKSGPFLEPPVLVRVFPQGLPKTNADKRGRLRAAYEEWAEAQEGRHEEANALHTTWVRLVLEELLEFDERILRRGDRLPAELIVQLAEHHETLRPSMALVEPDGRPKAGVPRLLIEPWPLGQDLESPVLVSRWSASPLERMIHLCRATGVRLGLVTNGERWTVVDAPVGQTAGFASWFAGLWLQEPSTLAAFETLLGVRRFFGMAGTDTLEAMLDESVAYQQEVTDQLGYQVRRAVEVLVQVLDRADFDRQRELLRDVPPERLYEAALTVMMRLVFLFCAEERGLLLLGDPTYDAYYAVSTIRAHLREEADRVGVEVLERRQDAWARLLATFRAVYGGIEHEMLRLPALGGSLFDPDRFPFLEGRAPDTTWLKAPASPLPIDNRTVLHLLDSLQLLRMRSDAGVSEARKLSYRSLDIEQIGHVYEGLLDHVAVRVESDALGLIGTKDKEPELSIDDLDRKRRLGEERLLEFLREQTGRSESALRKDLAAEIDEEIEQRLLVASGNDKVFTKRALPYHALMRKDVWGYPQVYRKGSFMVTGGPERRQTGTHYTPKSLTERIVAETLEPLVYVGPAEGKPRGEWALKSPGELLELKICDMAMGSAAFLVQVCRWLAERLVEAWEQMERSGGAVPINGEIIDEPAGHGLMPKDREERLVLGRRLVAERCVYGVDINPMAVELAKLSLWLATLAKGRPLGFLDHNLRSGDSLFGVVTLGQLENFHLVPQRGEALHHSLFDPRRLIKGAVDRALELRKRLRAVRILDIEDIRAMAELDAEARRVLEVPELVADLLMGAALATAGDRQEELDEQLVGLADHVTRWLQGDEQEARALRKIAGELLDRDCPEQLRPRKPFHWAVEFPEVFLHGKHRFDAIIGNPPFMRGHDISGQFGVSYRRYLSDVLYGGKAGIADLCAFFVLRSVQLVGPASSVGLVATNSISEGDTRRVSLGEVVQKTAEIVWAIPNLKWPGQAAVVVSPFVLWLGHWHGPRNLAGRACTYINANLRAGQQLEPRPLPENAHKCFVGSIVLGDGFLLTKELAKFLRAEGTGYEEIILPYLNGVELNSFSRPHAERWVICFWDWPLERARLFGKVFERVHSLVKPERDRVARRRYRDLWWLHAENRPGLYHSIGLGTRFMKHLEGWVAPGPRPERVIAKAKTSETWGFEFYSPKMIFDQAVTVIASEDMGVFAVVQSTVHETWARYSGAGSTMKTDLRYAPSMFDTFPFPKYLDPLRNVGSKYYAIRSATMRGTAQGMTAIYNRINDPADVSSQIRSLREIQARLDAEVVSAYGWGNMTLQHDFLETPRGFRFTIDEISRERVLERLLQLNQLPTSKAEH